MIKTLLHKLVHIFHLNRTKREIRVDRDNWYSGDRCLQCGRMENEESAIFNYPGI